MAKKKIDNPLFLEFINLPFIVDDDFSYHSGLRTIADVGNIFPWGNIEENNRINNFLKRLFKKTNISPKHASLLKQAIERLQQFTPADFKNNIPEYSRLIARVWCNIRNAVNHSIRDGKGVELIFKFQDVVNYFEEVQPTFKTTDTGKVEICFMPIPPKDSLETPGLVGFLNAEFIHFMIDEYKPGIFAYCNLKGSKQEFIDINGRKYCIGYEGCERIIIKTNGRKYCCDYHRKKASKLKTEKDKNIKERNRIKDRLRNQYNRYQVKPPMTRNEYVIKYWPKNKLHLLQLPKK